MTGGVWGGVDTGYFFELTPDRVLQAVEASGLRCTGRCSTMNSFENRVYEVELETDEDSPLGLRRNSLDSRRVVKFYRPGRWTESQILEEHEFLSDLQDAEIPIVAPIVFPDGKTLHSEAQSGILYAVFPKVGGRAPEELSDEQLLRVGRLLGRIHNRGAVKKAQFRIQLTPTVYGKRNLESLLEGQWIPTEFRDRYESIVRKICDEIDPWFQECRTHRIHGDCHLGNLLWNQDGPFFLDFDDMVNGPAVQDIWLLIPGRDQESKRQLEVLLEGYDEMRTFDRSQLRMIEALRALRIVHYSTWMANRWNDPAFPVAFLSFGTHRYWAEETAALETQWNLLTEAEGYGRF